ncbi:hypothetical protein TrCOL_g13642 [Triparma columacea]|uniref:Uncharacterized protein n=1 Tax=Triparma columacea TaxID=722753 RepID=A0A9W7L4W1_9STRA|nr:hypothetical protein TrCOL_g13642 [Triparma columacea]
MKGPLHKSSSMPTSPTAALPGAPSPSAPNTKLRVHNSNISDTQKAPPSGLAGVEQASVRDIMKAQFMSQMGRSQSAPDIQRRDSVSRGRVASKKQSTRRVLLEEPDLWERYFDEDWEEEPDWKLLLTGKLKRAIKQALCPPDRKKHSTNACEYVLKHWLHMKKLQVDAIHNKLGIKEHNLVEMDADLMLISPTFEEYVDGLLTICKMKSGGVWDMDQKVEMLVGVYGRTKGGHLNRDEFAEMLKHHAKVKPPPKPPKFETEDEQIEYERKVKRGEITVPNHMDQPEYELYLYRWLKKEFASWEKVQGDYVTLKTAITGMESNHMLEDHFSIDLWALLKEMKANDDKAGERLTYISVAENAYQKYQTQLGRIAPEKSDKRKEEMQKALFDMTSANLGRRTTSTAGTKKRPKKKKGK